jgi:hypothetical protein
VLALILLSVTAFLLIHPGIAGGLQSQLPLCCRANGKHRCAMHSAGRPESNSGPLIASAGERCPFSSAPASTAPLNPKAIPTGEGHVRPAIELTCSRVTVESECRFAMAFNPAHPKRGPPSFLY